MKVFTQESNRLFVLFLLVSVWGIFISVTLVKVQVFHYTRYVAKIKAQKTRVFDLHPTRGTIYDRYGEILAISIKAKSAFFNNKDITESRQLFADVVDRIKLPARDVRKIRDRIERGEKFIWIKRKLPDTELTKLMDLKATLKNDAVLNFVEEYQRVYPQQDLASHVLGGVGVDEQGLSGIEYALDSVIKGKGGKFRAEIDARRKIFNIENLENPVPGKDIYLTLDASIQFFVERELKQVIKSSKAKAGVVIVMDSRDGSILAMASYPDYQPDRIRYASSETMRNRAVSFLYEPGSTFKIVLAAWALENRICSPGQIFDCYDGTFQVRDREITDVKPFGKISFEDVIIHSSNIGAAKIGLRLGKNRYFQGITGFGFGSKLGIQLPAEERGILHPLNEWNEVELAFISDGYGIAVTPLQMTLAFNIIASGGYIFQPNILLRPASRIDERKERILSHNTVERLKYILSQVVEKGTGRKASIEGIDIAGKTGTAKKLKKGKYENIYVSTFGGFFPAENPRVTMFVLIDEPEGLYYGGDVAAPLFKSIAIKLMIVLNIFPRPEESGKLST